MGVLRSTDLRDTQNQVQVWCNFYTTGIRNSYGVSSISRTGTGTFTINFSYTLSSSGNSISGSSRASTDIGGGGNWAQYVSFYGSGTTSCGVHTLDNGDVGQGVNEDPAQASCIVHSTSSS